MKKVTLIALIAFSHFGFTVPPSNTTTTFKVKCWDAKNMVWIYVAATLAPAIVK